MKETQFTSFDPFEVVTEHPSSFTVSFEETLVKDHDNVTETSSSPIDKIYFQSESPALCPTPPTTPSPKIKESFKKSSKKPDYTKVAFDYSSLNTPKSYRTQPKKLSTKDEPQKLFNHQDHKKQPNGVSNKPGIGSSKLKEDQNEIKGAAKVTQPDDILPVSRSNYVDASTQTDVLLAEGKIKKKKNQIIAIEAPVEINGQPFDNEVEVPEEAIAPTMEPLLEESKPPNSKKTKGAYPNLYSNAKIKKGLANGTLFKGEIRVNSKYPSQAYVTVPGMEKDVFICSRQFRNRCLNGDTVIIAILSEAELKGIKDTIPVSVLENENMLGRVVGVQPKDGERLFVGIFDIKDKVKSFILFKPADKRFPFIAVSSQQIPKHVLENPEAAASTLFVVQLKDWSLKDPFPSGSVVRELGQTDDLTVGNEAILADLPFVKKEFTAKALSELPPVPFSFEDVDMSHRRDLRSLPCLTIDPPTARDLDDALSIRKLPDGTYKVWVHIADVSYFVPEGSALDAEAYHRATTFYMVDKSYPMLPNLLTQELCSLNPHVDRLAVSFSWTLDNEANILSSSYCRSLIHSRIKLSYKDAQRVIDSDDTEGLDLTEYPIEDLRKDLRELFRFSTILRKQRFEQGAITLGSRRLYFQLENSKPIQVSSDVQLDSNRLVEEFMLLANRSAAEKLIQAFPAQAILRRHLPPKATLLPGLLGLVKRLDLSLEPTTVQQLFLGLETSDLVELMQYHTVRSMQRASYVCSGMIEDYRHFALGMSSYTHFTSPIRRYSDILVHRQLMEAFHDKSIVTTKEILAVNAAHCSERKDSARHSQDLSGHLYLAHYLNAALDVAQSKSLPSEAMVVGLTDAWMDLVISKLKIDRRIYFKDLPLSKVQATSSCTILFWLDVPASPSFEANTLVNEAHDDLSEDESPSQQINNTTSVAQEISLLSKIPVTISVNLKVFPAAITIAVMNPSHIAV